MAQRRYSGDCTQLVHGLIKQLITANELNKTAIEQMLRDRSRVVEMDKRMKPIGRVLVIDTPPVRPELNDGTIEVYSDPGVDLVIATSPVEPHDPVYETALEWELRSVAQRFREMPWEVGPRYHTSWARRSFKYRFEQFKAQQQVQP